MFDPKDLLDAIVAGAAHRPQEGQGPQRAPAVLAIYWAQLAKAAQPGQQQQELPQAGGGGQMTGGVGRDWRHPEQARSGRSSRRGGGQSGIDLGEILRKLGAGGGTRQG